MHYHVGVNMPGFIYPNSSSMHLSQQCIESNSNVHQSAQSDVLTLTNFHSGLNLVQIML